MFELKEKRDAVKRVSILFLIVLILLPIVIRESGISPRDYESRFDIEGASFLEVDGYETYYIDLNRDFKETVLFVHGFGGSATNWIPVMDMISEEGYRLVAVDLKGFGFSEKRKDKDYSHSSQVKFLNSFVENLGIEKFTFVGHSMGGNIAVMYYQEHPEKVNRLVLVSGAVSTEEREMSFRNNLIRLLDKPVVRDYVRVFLRSFYSETRIKSTFESAIYKDIEIEEPLFVNPTIFKGWEYVLIKIASASSENVLERPVEEIDVPTRLIWGEKDTWVPLSRGERLKEKIPNSRLIVLEDTGHLPMLEDPEAFVLALKESFED